MLDVPFPRKLTRESDTSVILIHDVIEGRDATWPKDMLTTAYPHAEVLPYGYDAGSMRGLNDLLDSDRLEDTALTFLRDLDIKLQHPSTAVTEGDVGKTEIKKHFHHPMIILAHGYGGLIYEKALVMSHERKDDSFDKSFVHLHQCAFLFGTPHFSAGLGEWAIMCARRRGLHCAKTARTQKWEASAEQSVEATKAFQRSLRGILKKQHKLDPTIRIFGCFATSPNSDTKLMLSSKWAVMPEFKAVSVGEDHYGMTKLNRSSKQFDRVFDILDHQLANPSAVGPQPSSTPMEDPGDKLAGKAPEAGPGLEPSPTEVAKDSKPVEPTSQLPLDRLGTCDFDDWAAKRVFKVLLYPHQGISKEFADTLKQQLKARISGDVQVVPIDPNVSSTSEPPRGVRVVTLPGPGIRIDGLDSFFMLGSGIQSTRLRTSYRDRARDETETLTEKAAMFLADVLRFSQIYRLPMRSISMGAPQPGIHPPFYLDVLDEKTGRTNTCSKIYLVESLL
ncbi:hypothetical protein PG984_005205 [Apiospora sp. TS-2023a]